MLATAAGRAALGIGSGVQIGIDLESELTAIDLYWSGSLHKAFVNNKCITVAGQSLVGFFLLIQSKTQLRAASSGCQVHPDGRDFGFVGKVLIQELFSPISQS